jgi:7-cyano-7-deazaguanine synthase
MANAILLSGGLDSIALAYWKRPDYAITINYGHKPAEGEIRASRAVAKNLDIEHSVVEVDCSELGSGDLAGKEALEMAPESEWWPYRNQHIITLGCMKGISLGINEIILGTVNSDDFHEDGTPDFFKKINELILLQEGNIKITTPAIEYSSVELIQKAKVPKKVLLWAHSCHKNNIACGNCRGCTKYHKTMKQLGYK